MATDLSGLVTADAWTPLLTETERRVVAAAASADPLDLATGGAACGEPQRASAWVPDRVVRSRVLEVLLLGQRNDWPLHPSGLTLIRGWIDGDLTLDYGDVAVPLRLERCVIDGNLAATGTSFRMLALPGTQVCKVVASGAHVTGNVVLSEGFRVSAGLTLVDARIGGQIDCRGGVFVNENGGALTADGVHVSSRVYLGEGFNATGEVRLVGARIGGQLNCRGGTFTNPDGRALVADGAHIDRRVVLGGRFAAFGEVRFVGARIGGQLDCHDGSFNNPEGAALAADDLDVVGSLNLAGAVFTGSVRMSGTHVGLLSDDVRAWPAGWTGDGFEYRDFAAAASTNVDERLQWLQRQHGELRPGPYSHLAAVYRKRGNPEAARAVLIARERGRTQNMTIWRRSLRRTWALVSSYGYRPWRAVIGLALLIAVGTVVFSIGSMTELGGDEQVTYYSSLYAADLAIPLIDLRQANDYQPSEPWAQWWMWATITIGWFLSGAFLAAVTGVFTPDD